MDYMNISGPYNNEAEATIVLDKHYGGEEGPFWTQEDDSGNWWVVVDSDYYDN